MKILISLMLIFTYSFFIKAQNYIYHGDNMYESTNTWRFSSNASTGPDHKPEITVAKAKKGGYLMLSVSTPFNEIIKGTVFLFLNDGTVIKCLDKGVRDNVDHKAISLYNLTIEEIEKLKKNRIIRIRYSMSYIVGIGEDPSSNYTANNENLFTSKNYETEKEIKELFKDL